MGTSRLKELDALRGIAALSVVLFHYSVMAGFDSLLLKVGVTGVDLFFLISGYVILLTLEKTRTAGDFIVSRISRLYPSYITLLFLTTATIYFFNKSQTPSAREIALNLTMMQPIFRVRYIDDSYWTLTVEMQFYIFMLLIFMAGRLKDIEWISLIFLTVLILYYFIASAFFENSRIYIAPRSFIPFINHFQLFFSGILFYKLRTDGMKVYRHFLLLICLLFSLFLFDKSGRSHFFIGILPYTFMMILYFSAFYLFILGKLKFLNIPVFTGLGAVSYCMYLFHQEIGRILFAYLTSVKKVPVVASLFLLLILVLLISFLITYYIERPCIALIRSKWMKKRISTGQVEAA
jgi:peptidoglycan/LPS O-acetylase OafA/YrhL